MLRLENIAGEVVSVKYAIPNSQTESPIFGVLQFFETLNCVFQLLPKKIWSAIIISMSACFTDNWFCHAEGKCSNN
jgi:hypothetical protein